MFCLLGCVCSSNCSRRLISSVVWLPVCRAGGRGFEPAGPTLRVLRKCFLCYDTYDDKSSDKDGKPSPASSLSWFSRGH